VEDAQTAARHRPNDPRRASSPAPRQAAPARPHDPDIAGAAHPPRPSRWAAAVAALVNLQDEYRAWLDNLPPNREGSRLAEKLQAIAELDLEELQTINPPRGYGRD
jgi:hypothetical protein